MGKVRIISGLLIILGLYSCGKVSYRELEPVVSKDLVTFPGHTVPPELLMEAGQHSIILLGETHYVQEHQEWGSLLLEELSEDGYTLFMNELPYASGWLVNDYVNGDLDQIPERIRYFDDEWLENIREINSSLEIGGKIQFYYIDVNHSIDDFRYSLIEIENILGDQPLFQRVLSDPFDSQTYRTSLLTLQTRLVDRKEELVESLGQIWFDRIVDIVEFEIPSLEYRLNNDENLREGTMYNIIKKIIDNHGVEKAVINAGMFHAQKMTLMGYDIPRIAQLLEKDFPGGIYSISFNGIRGLSMIHFYDDRSITIDLINNTTKRDLMHIIGVRAGSMLSYLSLDDPVFEKDMKVTYTKTDTKVLSPRLQFDAIISYPEITNLKSLTAYEY